MISAVARSLPQLRMSATISVTRDQVHVWHASLDRGASETARLEKHLTPDELSRATRFRRAVDRQRFVTCRGMLREILSRYVGEGPEEIEFGYAKHGKPYLKSSHGAHAPRFNVSHSGGLAVFAITRDREVGVDIERLKANFAWEEIATSFFSSPEIQVLHSLPVQHQYEAFLNVWTSKEACAKARGEGLSLPFEHLEVGQLPDGAYPLRWTLKTFAPVAGFAGAVVVEGADCQMTCREWRE